jgi:hypothetical protein
MKRAISSGSYSVLSSLLSLSSSSLELSSTTFLLLLFFVALKAMYYLFKEMGLFNKHFMIDDFTKYIIQSYLLEGRILLNK